MKRQWWHNKIAYQIYPKSFYDTNNDGIGDINGIIEKLDYLKELGIDMIWISPIYKSPFVDQGYDISDYYKIAEQFGTMEEFDKLLQEAKKRDMYILMDLVINHCSDKHEWFQKALKDPEGEYAEYFYFREGNDGSEPSNYRSYFGGSTWEKVPGTDKYYFHSFAKEQPDLNWYNPKVRESLYKMINWWLDKGLAGFRIDAIINICKDLSFPSFECDGDDNLASIVKMIEKANGIGEMLEDMKHHTFEKYNAFTVAEVFDMNEEEFSEFIGDNGHFSTIFDFSAHKLMHGKHGWYDAEKPSFELWRDAIFEGQLKSKDIGFLANIIENHDEPRGASTYLPAYADNDDGVKMLATTSILLRGIPFIYQGQEIGMRNCPMHCIDEYNDIDTKNQYEVALKAGFTEEEALKICFEYSRDNARTPMQWSNKKNAGFTKGKPWLKVNPNYEKINVESQLKDENSVLNYYKKLIAFRKSKEFENIFVYGSIEPAYLYQDKIFAFYRILNETKILVVANFGKEDAEIELYEKPIELLLSNKEDKVLEGPVIKLKTCEVNVVLINE